MDALCMATSMGANLIFVKYDAARKSADAKSVQTGEKLGQKVRNHGQNGQNRGQKNCREFQLEFYF
jgi:hypothetical protein